MLKGRDERDHMMGSRRATGNCTQLLGILAAAAIALAAPPAALSSARTSMSWMLAGNSMKKICAEDPGLAAYFFDTRRALVIGNEDGNQDQRPCGYAARRALKYESYARFRADVRGGHIIRSVKTVIYDPENWSMTPDSERRDPKIYFRRFWKLAHRTGYQVIQSPARDLMQVMGAACRQRSGENLSHAFLRCRIAATASRYADTYKVQAQVLENSPRSYRAFVRATRKQARGANPSVRFMSNLATSPQNYVATAEMLLNAHDAVKDLVSGHFLTINTSELEVAVDFLRMVRDADSRRQ
jgi:hypothetical protein